MRHLEIFRDSLSVGSRDSRRLKSGHTMQVAPKCPQYICKPTWRYENSPARSSTPFGRSYQRHSAFFGYLLHSTWLQYIILACRPPPAQENMAGSRYSFSCYLVTVECRQDFLVPDALGESGSIMELTCSLAYRTSQLSMRLEMKCMHQPASFCHDSGWSYLTRKGCLPTSLSRPRTPGR
jgi:hypothetical protein